MSNKRTAFYLFVLISVCFILFIIFYNQFKMRWQEREMERHAIVIEEDYWALDSQGPLKYLTLVSQRESFGSISIYGLNGEEFLQIDEPEFTGFDSFLDNIGLIPETIMQFDIVHDDEVIGYLTAAYRNKNIYIYFYAFIVFILIYFVVILFLKTVGDKHQLEHRVRERTIELEEEIEERIKIEMELKEARNYISNIIDSMPSILISVDSEGRITQCNKTAEEMTGIDRNESVGRYIDSLIPQMKTRMVYIRESIDSGDIKQEQKVLIKENGNIRYADITIYPLTEEGAKGAVIRLDDVTNKVRLEEMMIQSEKMLSVGGLAAGMAHEINNPLGGMMQTAHVMENRLGKNLDMPGNVKAAEEAGTTMEAIKAFMDSRGIPRMINSINESGRRVAEIIENMLSFSRKSDGQSTTRNVNELIDKTLELAYSDYDLKKQYDFKLVSIEKDFSEDLPMVPCQQGKIQQVLLNILRNGAQAMQKADTEKPTFLIRTYRDDGRKMVCMEIQDNGPGMDENTRKRVFEPFFTTKEVGVGTGLGLSVSYFIITENHNGEMEVESHPGEGARFIIRLPY
ncbi:MAG: PAS domain S-box protein [Spirochaetales bacterium]|nr:PAS domain S-box protein [Spirochaetales bacterium]